jgi:hypothetical protein
MTTYAETERRELARRTNNGIEVALFWSDLGNRVTIELADTRFDEFIEFEVAGADALDAFYHPFAYIYRRHPDALAPAFQAVTT